MAFDLISLNEMKDREAESAGQDQTTNMSSLILLYTRRILNALSRVTG